MGFIPYFAVGPPRPTNNGHDLKSTSGNDRIISVTRSWNPFYGDATDNTQLKDSELRSGNKNLARLVPQTLLPIQKRSTLMSCHPTNASPMKLRRAKRSIINPNKCRRRMLTFD